MEDLRPLMLSEASRKIWTSLILSRIQHAIKEHHLLNSAQHGYLSGRGTNSASLIFINLVESAKDLNTVSHRTSYDMSRAFDSVSKNIMRIAWHRLGVPPDVIEWLVELDTDGVTIVRSPFALANWALADYRSVLTPLQPPSPPLNPPHSPLTSPFLAVRGTGQGNPDSPTCWNGVFDIALTALSIDAQARGADHHATGLDGNSILGSENGYADDLVSVHELATEIQRKADIMSAFCLICGVSLSHKKLRRVVQSWIAHKIPTHHLPMKVHDYGWIPRDIEIKVDGATEYLGGLYNLDGSGAASKEAVREIAISHSNAIRACYASPMTKLLCYSTSSTSKITYKQILNNLSLTQLQETDKAFYPMLISATRNMGGFPKALIHLPTKYCGLGISSTLDRTLLGKWSALHSALYSGDTHAMAAEGLLHRAAAASGHHLLANQGVILHHSPNHTRWWLTNLLEWGASFDGHLCRQGATGNSLGLLAPIPTGSFFFLNKP